MPHGSRFLKICLLIITKKNTLTEFGSAFCVKRNRKLENQGRGTLINFYHFHLNLRSN